ncbi:MAG: four helix bundle protein [Verrucomicrobia bacterium]|nr:four helix bundle protein [Verrucomicrobiota bacterium]
MNLKSYRELEVWKKSMNLAETVYSVSKPWPKEEIYGLTKSLRSKNSPPATGH